MGLTVDGFDSYLCLDHESISNHHWTQKRNLDDYCAHFPRINYNLQRRKKYFSPEHT